MTSLTSVQISQLAYDCGFRDNPREAEEFARKVITAHNDSQVPMKNLSYEQALTQLKARHRICNDFWEDGDWAIMIAEEDITVVPWATFNSNGVATLYLKGGRDKLLEVWNPTSEELACNQYHVL